MKRMILSLMLLAAVLPAQRGGVSYIQYLENGVTILPADGSNALQAGLNIPLYPGDRLETDRQARIEVVLAEGAVFWADQRTRVEFRALAKTDGFSDRRTYLYLAEGQAALDVPVDPERGGEPVLGFASGDFYAFSAGLFSLERRGRSATLRLFSGRGELVTDRGSVLLQAGEEAVAYEDGFVDRRRLRRDVEAFASWVEQRRELRLRSQSAQHAGGSLSSYSYALDRNGSWVYMPDIAVYAWRPVVEVGWQPYYNGYWDWYGGAWFWVGYEPWSYVTHHYGRWFWHPGYGWMWVPGYVWAPAWVYWYWDPFYIGWSPCGYWDYWWWSGCGYGCWGWDHHHGGHGHGDHDGNGGGHGGGDYRQINGHVNLARLDKRPFVFAETAKFGRGQAALTAGAQFKGNLETKGALAALDLPLRKGDLGDPMTALQRASLQLKADLTPLFRKDFTATAQVKQMLSDVRTRAAGSAERVVGIGGAEPRSAALPSGQAPPRQPMCDRVVRPLGGPSRGPAGTAEPAVVAPSGGRSGSPAPRPSPTAGAIPTPSGQAAPSPSGKTAPEPSGKAAPTPSSTAPPRSAPEAPKQAAPSKSGLTVTNVSENGAAGTLRIDDPQGRLRSRDRGSGAFSVAGEAHWEQAAAGGDRATPSASGRQPVHTGRSSAAPAPTTFDRTPVSVPSTESSGPSADRTYSSPVHSYSTDTPSYRAPYTPTPSYTPASGGGRTTSAPAPSYSPSGAGRGSSLPSPSYSPSSGSGRGGSAPAPSSSGHSAPSPSSHSSPSASSHSAPKK
jgi:hypothetical protein